MAWRARRESSSKAGKQRRERTRKAPRRSPTASLSPPLLFSVPWLCAQPITSPHLLIAKYYTTEPHTNQVEHASKRQKEREPSKEMLLGGPARAAVVFGQQQPQQRPASVRLPRVASSVQRQQQQQQQRRAGGATMAAVAEEKQQSLRCVDASSMSEAELQTVLARPRIDFSSILSTVRSIESEEI